MSVITDLFDISEPDWFTSRLDKSPSNTSSLQHSETNLLLSIDHTPTQPLQQPLDTKDLQLELLTPDVDTSENSFNVLTTHSQKHHFHHSLDSDFAVDLPHHIAHLPLEEQPISFNNHQLQYTNTNTTATVENSLDHSLDHIFQPIQTPLKLDNHLQPPLENPVPAPTDHLSFDDFYHAISPNGHPLPDVCTYISELAATAPVLDSAYPEKPKQRRKRKLSKREVARAASAAELAREEELAMLAKTKQITDDELLRLKPKKQRRAARFDKPVPSRFCHVCSRTPKNVRLVVCCKIKEGICRKVICEKCFEEYGWGNFEEALKTDSSEWVCPHCAGLCPERAQCRTYQRINDRLRVNRLKQEGPRCGRRRVRRQMEERVEIGDEKRPRFLLPAMPGGFGFEEGEGF